VTDHFLGFIGDCGSLYERYVFPGGGAGRGKADSGVSCY